LVKRPEAQGLGSAAKGAGTVVVGGQENDEPGYALVAPDTLRQVILMTDESSKKSFGDG
jgi:hypothetical protein